MTNFNGFYFNEALNAEFKLVNNFFPTNGEFNLMRFGLFNHLGNGYIFSNITDYINSPSFRLEKIIDDINTTLLEYIPSNATFDFKTNRVAGGDPVNNSDYVTKGYLENGNVITNINYTTSSEGITVSSSTSGSTTNLSTDLNNNLNSLAGLNTTGVVLSNTSYSYMSVPFGTSGQLFTMDVDGIPKFKNSQTVTSVGLATTSTGLNITNTPITSTGNISVNLTPILQSIADLQSNGLLEKLGTTTSVIAKGTEGQVLAVQNSAFTFIDRFSSIAITGSNGLSILGSPVTTTGTIDIILSNILQSLALLGTNGLIVKNSSTISSIAIPPVDGQIPTSLAGSISWITPAAGGNVTGAGTTTVNALGVWGNTVGTQLNNSNIIIDSSSNLDLGFKRIVSMADPVNDNDATTKLYVRNLIISTLGTYVRTGTVYVGDVAGSPTGDMAVSGDIISATKTNLTSSESLVTINYTNLGYIPIVLVQWSATNTTSVANDVWIPTPNSRTETQTKIYIEEVGSVIQNGTLLITLMKSGIN